MSDWDEIKRLAADFQRTQTSDTLQKISERNCIDILKKLTDLSLIELIYTCDGKEFLTPDHLLKEIEDEIYVNGGRMHLHDLASNLNVDYQHVENKAKLLARDRSDEYNLILGQVIHSTYKKTLGKQISETMITSGHLSIADFAKALDLPSEFLLALVKELLPQVIDDYVTSPDERTFYTTDMMDRYKSIIAGTLSAVTKPTTIASIMKKLDIPEKLFNTIIEGLIKDGRVDAAIENRLFIPSVYAREQNEWIDKFYTTNSLIDFDVLARKDIKQPKAFLKRRFPDGIALKNCFVSPNLVSQVESLVEDCIASNGLMDISTVVPASIQPDDIELMLLDLFKKNKQFSSSCLIFQQTNICSLGYIATCKQSFGNMMTDKAKDHLKQGKLANYFLGSKFATNSTSQSGQQLKNSKEEEQQNQCKDLGETIKSDNKMDNVDSGDPKVDNTGDQEEQSGKFKGDDIEFKAEDLKRERRQKRGKQRAEDDQDSELEQSGRKSKGGINRKSGGGAQGREIKQRATKKKYQPGKSKHANDNSDEENDLSSSKTPRSSKGRAARRGISPSDRQISSSQTTAPARAGGARQSKSGAKSTSGEGDLVIIEKKPLEFMSMDELIESLRNKSRDSGEFSDEMLESIASMMVEELNNVYESLAKKLLDEHLRKSTKTGDEDVSVDDEEEDIDLVE